SIDKWLVPFVNMLYGFWKWLMDKWRYIAFPDSQTAEKGMKARIEASDQFDKLVNDLKLDPTMTLASGQTMKTSDYLKQTCENAIKHLINDGELTNDPKRALGALARMHRELATTVELQLRAKFARTPADEEKLGLQNIADRAVSSYISGIDLEALN